MAHYKALVCVGLICFAFAVAGGASVDNSGNVKAKQSQSQSSANSADYNNGPVNQQSSNQGIQQAGNGNKASNDNDQTIKGRKLLADSYIRKLLDYINNSGDVTADQSQSQSSSNSASYNNGPVNQQSSNQAIQQAGNGNSASNDDDQYIEGRRLLAIDNSGNVKAKQSQSQSSANSADYNNGPVNQQSSNQGIQQAGNGNKASNDNDQTIKGRRLLDVDNSGNVKAKQSQSQSSANSADYNNGPVNQQSSNQGIQQAGNGNKASNANDQTIKGRRLLDDVDNSGDVDADQSQSQTSSNSASYNNGPVNQQSSNQAIQQAGNGNSASNDNDQYIEGRRLLAVDNSGNVKAKQSQSQSSANSADYNNGPVNQQSSNQGIQQAGNGNSASNDSDQTIKGRKLRAVDNSGNVKAKQSQSQSSANSADYNNGPVNQQSSNQGIQQAGNGNSASNDNDQTIKP